ncbi:MAG: TonB-dependent receptor [Henriciella sp.]
MQHSQSSMTSSVRSSLDMNWKYERISYAALAGAMAVGMVSAPAIAQEDEGARTLGAVIVSAERRDDNLQNIPLAVTALPATELDEQQIVTTKDLARAVPNLVISNNVGLGTSVTYFLRGVGSSESIPTFDLPVGTYVDEVYISRQSANQVALSGVERVEVLRGPQGTLFGRNTTGGAVQIISEKPGDEFGGEVELGYGSFERVQLNGAVNLPVSDKVAFRLSGLYIDDEGFVDNVNNNEKYNGEETFGLRGAVRVDLTDSISWNASAQFTETDTLRTGPPEVLDGTTFTGTRQPTTGDLLTIQLDDTSCEPSGAVSTWASQGCVFNTSDTTLLISNLEFGTDAGTLNFITGYYDNEFKYNIDFLGNTNQPVFGGLFGSNFYISNFTSTEQISQEIKWTADVLDGRLSYVTGLFYLDESNETEFTDTVFIPVATPLAIREPLANDTESIAAYFQADYDLTDRLTGQFGLRWTNEEKTLDLSGSTLNFGTFAYDPLDNAALTAVGIPLEQTVSLVTPRAALFYEVSDDISLYGSYTEGFKSGGWNVRGTSAIELQPFGKETVESFELGVRSELFENRLRLNATLFQATYGDFQVPTVFPGSSTFLTLNSGEAEVTGLEVDFKALVTDSLDVFGNFGFMDSEYTELSAGAIASGIGPKLQRSPEFTGRIGAAQTLEFGAGHELKLIGDVSYTDDYVQLPDNSFSGIVESATLVNLQAAWTLPSGNLRVVAECSNCTDEVYQVSNLFSLIYPSDPRRLGIRIAYDF